MVFEVVRKSLKSTWRKAEFEELAFQVVPDGHADELLKNVDEAVQATNAWAFDQCGPDAAPFGEGVTLVGKRVMAVISRPGLEPELWRWFDFLASDLAGRGLAGRIRGATEVIEPQWACDPAKLGWGHAAYLRLPTAGRRANQPLPDRSLLERVVAYGVEWGSLPQSVMLMTRGEFTTETANVDVLRQLMASAESNFYTRVSWLDRPGRRRKDLSIHGANVALSSADLAMPWAEHTHGLTTVLRDLGPVLRHAAMRRGPTSGFGWTDLSRLDFPRPPGGQHTAFDQFDDLFDTKVPDAYGAQILTEDLYRRAGDLSGWHHEDLPGGRHLVAAKDAESWFAHAHPADEVVAAARRDFGDLVLNEDDRMRLGGRQ